MNRAPAFQFYAADWFDFKVDRMSYAAQGIYMRLLAYMWKDSKDQCSLIDSNEDIAAALKIPAQEWLEYRKEIQRENSPIFLEKNGRLISKRLKVEADKQRNYRQIQKDKALSRQASSRLARSSAQASSQLGGSLHLQSSSSNKEEEISLSRARESSLSEMEIPELGPEPDLVAENKGPEIAIFVQITGRHPHLANYGRIKAALQGKKRAEVEPFFEEWCARDYKTGNLGWLEWVRSGAIPARNGARASPSPPVAHKPPCPECKQNDSGKREMHWQKYEDEDALKQHFYESLPADIAQRRYADIIGPWKTKRRLLEQERDRA